MVTWKWAHHEVQKRAWLSRKPEPRILALALLVTFYEAQVSQGPRDSMVVSRCQGLSADRP